MIRFSNLIFFGFCGYIFSCIFGTTSGSSITIHLGFWNVPSTEFTKQSYYIIYIVSMMLGSMGIIGSITNYISEKLGDNDK